ncbi:MAG: hypothetical protein Ta2G_05370 [Termitinemataceae bacterium]|nr:MAG: hypothetical protein Ta2G_05370 [Termitinemataceae bacterium]
MKNCLFVFMVIFSLFSLFSCTKRFGGLPQEVLSQESIDKFLAAVGTGDAGITGKENKEMNRKQLKEKISITMEKAKIPSNISMHILAADQDEFLKQLEEATGGDEFLYILVDKQHKLPNGYEPSDLVHLAGEGKSYTVARNNLYLRQAAENALQIMALDARAQGITLMASSTYRSYDYQVQVYERNVRQNGRETADRESARPGYSQHQLGLIVDFGSISDEYADTPGGRFLANYAHKYGWSISFPDGYEDVTGYRYECWHYRYVGREAANFINTWFGGIQQYALQFIHVWKNGEL